MKVIELLVRCAVPRMIIVQAIESTGALAPVIEVVTFKLKPGVSAAAFREVDKDVEVQHVARQPGFVSRESAAGEGGEWLVIVHWRTAKEAEASMASFSAATAAAAFLSKIEAPTMSMRRYQRLAVSESLPLEASQ